MGLNFLRAHRETSRATGTTQASLRRKLGTLAVALAVIAVPLAATPAQAARCIDCPPPDDPPPGGGGGGGYGAPVTLKGHFTYVDDTTSGGTFQRPISNVKVEIWRYSPGPVGIWIWGKFATVTTNTNGDVNYTTPIGTPGTVYAMRVFATNNAAVVWPHTVLDPGGPYWAEPGAPGSPIHRTANNNGDVLTFDYDFTDRNRGKYFNIAETLRRARAFADARRSDTDHLWQVPVQPSAVATFYNAPARQIDLASASTYTDLVIVHEYAHFLEDQIGSLYAVPTVHDGCLAKIGGIVVNTPEHAWMEGFANWFAQAVHRSDPGAGLVGTSSSGGGTFSLSEIESPSCPLLPPTVSGNAVEKFVAGSLWDVTDSAAGESFDGLGGLESQVFGIFDGPMDSSRMGLTMPTINLFRTSWNMANLPQPAFDSILTGNRVAPL